MSTSYTAQSQCRRSPRSESVDRPSAARQRSHLSVLEIVALIVIAGLLIAGALRTQPQGASISEAQTVQVQTGQTLWAIAQAHPIAGLTTAQTAEAISRSNNLPGSMLSAGQTLRVPAGESAGSQLASR